MIIKNLNSFLFLIYVSVALLMWFFHLTLKIIKIIINIIILLKNYLLKLLISLKLFSLYIMLKMGVFDNRNNFRFNYIINRGSNLNNPSFIQYLI